MNTVFVITDDGTRLMPTHAAKARILLHSGKAIIEKYRPFTIRLRYHSTKNVQPVEIAVDTGYIHIGLSIKSQRHEYISAQYDLLKDEVERHNNCCKYRRARRNRLRYRKPRFNNRRKPEGWFAPSLQNKIDTHIRLIKSYYDVCPVKDIYIECGQFFEKCRRNNRILSKFYDAKYIDSRDGTVKSGAQLSCGRTNRNHNRDADNLHQYRQWKKSKGGFSIRRQRYSIQPNDTVIYQGKKYLCKGCHCMAQGLYCRMASLSQLKKVTIIKHAGNWKPVL